MSSEVKHRNGRSQKFHFNGSEVKQRSEDSQMFNFKCSEVKYDSERSQRFHILSFMPGKLFLCDLY